MAVIPMALAVSGEIASAAEYNKIRQNILDMDIRITTTEGANANSRLNALEALTTNTATNGGQGNARLADRLGTGVGTGTNVTTGNAASQLGDLRTRATSLEGRTTTVENRTTAAGSGNADLNTRVASLESANGIAQLVRVVKASGTTNLVNDNWTPLPWTSAPRNPNSMWAVGNPSRITIPSGQGGLYFFNGLALLSTNTTGARICGLRINGNNSTIIRCGGPYYNTTAGVFHEIPISAHAELAASDYVELVGWCTGVTGTVSFAISGDNPYLVARRVA